MTLMREMPVKRAGQILRESDTRMWRMLFRHVKAAYERLSFDNVVWVGADEMNRRKGRNYRTVFADLVAKRVLFVTPGIDAAVWEAFAEELLRHNGHPKAIQHVAIDMSATTRGASAINSGTLRWCTTSSISSRKWWRRATRYGRPKAVATPGSGTGWSGCVRCGARTE